MPEDVTRELKALTPVAPDRDAILFAAGKAAGRRWGGWKWLAVGLLVSNTVTLGVFFWPRPIAPIPRVVVTPVPIPADVPTEPHSPESYSYIVLRHTTELPRPADAVPVAPSAPLTPRSLSDPRFN